MDSNKHLMHNSKITLFIGKQISRIIITILPFHTRLTLIQEISELDWSAKYLSAILHRRKRKLT